MDQPVQEAEITFRERFCAHFARPETEYERAALKLFLHRPWAYFANSASRIWPKLFATEIQIIQQLGRVSSGSNFSAEVLDIRNDYLRQGDFGFLRKWLKFRLSRERIFRVSKQLWNR